MEHEETHLALKSQDIPTRQAKLRGPAKFYEAPTIFLVQNCKVYDGFHVYGAFPIIKYIFFLFV